MELKIEYVPIETLKPYAGNAKLHPAAQVEQIKESIEEFDFCDPIAVWTNPDGELEIVAGHGRLLAALEKDLKEIPIYRLDHLTDEERRAYALVHNKLTMNSGFDDSLLEIELSELDQFDMEKYGFEIDDFVIDVPVPEKASMADKYLVPPFSVIYTNKQKWLERKRQWIALGIHSEIGRGGELAFAGQKRLNEIMKRGR